MTNNWTKEPIIGSTKRNLQQGVCIGKIPSAILNETCPVGR